MLVEGFLTACQRYYTGRAVRVKQQKPAIGIKVTRVLMSGNYRISGSQAIENRAIFTTFIGIDNNLAEALVVLAAAILLSKLSIICYPWTIDKPARLALESLVVASSCF